MAQGSREADVDTLPIFPTCPTLDRRISTKLLVEGIKIKNNGYKTISKFV
jgi:hypothetical protein